MYQANPNHLYVDADGVLDAVMRGGRMRHEAAHYTGLPNERIRNYDAKAQCTFVRWTREGDCVAPVMPTSNTAQVRAQLQRNQVFLRDPTP